MIKIRLRGRLGNQMFQFAFGALLSKKKGTKLLLDTNFQKFELGYFCLTGFFRFLNNSHFLRGYNFIQRKITSKASYDYRDCFLEHDYSNISSSAYIDGYFQDFRLYVNDKEEIKKIFKIRPRYRKVYKAKYREVQLNKRTIVISFRFGDYATFDLFQGASLIVPVKWYADILSRIDVTDAIIYCISDDINYVKEHFNIGHEPIYFVKDDMITQLLLLQHADICIISNSTFAWWGAFLNNKAQAIYCPRYFLGFPVSKEIPPNIYPENWIKVPVTQQEW